MFLSSRPPRILIVAGSDSGGGAGIQADIKTVMALGGYATTAITALTAQNTLGVTGIHPVPPAFVAAQMQAVLEDIGTDAIKTGMLVDAGVIEAVAGVLGTWIVDRGSWAVESAGAPHDSRSTIHHPPPLILDPVMIAKGGAPLLAPQAVAALKSLLIPHATLLTPNIPEAEALTGMTIRTPGDQEAAAQALLALGAGAVLVKGGHAAAGQVVDVLVTPELTKHFSAPRLETRSTHGTGCTLASAIATFLAQGTSLEKSIDQALNYVRRAMRHAPAIGRGHGPLQHFVQGQDND